MIKLCQSQNIQHFCDRTREVLVQHEAEHNLLLSILHALGQRLSANASRSYLAWIEENNRIQGAVLHMPHRNVILSKISKVEGIALLAEDILRSGRQPPGVAGLPHEVRGFVQVWQQMTQQSAWVATEMQIYQLTQVQITRPKFGKLRKAESCDRTLVLDWSKAFDLEALGQVQNWTEQSVDLQLQQGNVYLWEDKEPVSMAMGRGSKPGGGHIGSVYTPPEYRCRGYATACVTALSQHLLNQGYRSCFLFTDQAHLTSNHTYQTIGYEYRCDWLDYRFGQQNYRRYSTRT